MLDARVRQVLHQIALLLGATVAYLGVRGLTAGDPATAEQNAHAVLRFERHVGLEWEAGVQRLLLDEEHVVRVFNAVYVWGFWPVVAGALVVLYRRDRDRYRTYRNALFLSGLVGLAVFATFPVAPPRFLTGYTDTVALLSGHDEIAHPSGLTNEYAAMPSFHVGWTVLAVVALLPVIRRTIVRHLAIAHAALMSCTVVVTANHYVVDVAAGVAVTLAALLAVRAVDTNRSRAATPASAVIDLTPAVAAVVVSPAARPSPGGSAVALAAPRRRRALPLLGLPSRSLRTREHDLGAASHGVVDREHQVREHALVDDRACVQIDHDRGCLELIG
jgi:hypothetical protein